jgi:hypothetical protein
MNRRDWRKNRARGCLVESVNGPSTSRIFVSKIFIPRFVSDKAGVVGTRAVNDQFATANTTRVMAEGNMNKATLSQQL